MLGKTLRSINGTGQDKRQNTRQAKNYKAKKYIDNQVKKKVRHNTKENARSKREKEVKK